MHNRLLLFRNQADLSRKQLAELVGVNDQTIGFIERGDYSPSLELAFKLARALHVEVTDLFSDVPFEPLIKKG